MHKSRRLRKITISEKLPIIIYTEYPEPDRIKRIKDAWIGTTTWPCIILGPGEEAVHPDYFNYEYRKV